MKRIIILLNVASLIAALIWLMYEQSLEPLITSIGLIASLITLIYSNSTELSNIKMSQKGGKKSNNYQSAGDITVKNKR